MQDGPPVGGTVIVRCRAKQHQAAEPRGWNRPSRRGPDPILLHEPIVMLQATFGSLDGAARVRLTHERIQRLDPADLEPSHHCGQGRRQGQESREFLVNGKRILVLMEGSGDPRTNSAWSRRASARRGRLDRVRPTSNCTRAPIRSRPAARRWRPASFFAVIWQLQRATNELEGGSPIACSSRVDPAPVASGGGQRGGAPAWPW